MSDTPDSPSDSALWECPRCGGTEQASNRACANCKRARDRETARERRARAKRDADEHIYADVLNDEGEVIAEGNAEVPPGFLIDGVSQFDKVSGRWIKTKRDKADQWASMVEAVESIAEKLPREPLIDPPAVTTDRLLAAYLLGDPHVGMYSWASETGNSFDLEIAERELVAAVDYLVANAPAADTAIVFNAGDFFHSDNQSNRTNRSGAALDVDGRWSKVLDVGIRILCRVIDRALEKHRRVVVRNEIGNHDDHSSIMLAHCLRHHYMDNPRVEVDTSPSKFWYFEWGACLFGTTHGDTVKIAALAEIMAADQGPAWGRTKHHHWWTGHVHHKTWHDLRGCSAQTLRTVAPADAWHRAEGYRSRQGMECQTWHIEHGLQLEQHAPIELVRELIGAA